MKSKMFMPDKLNVGFQKRSGTYTGKLAYVIYFDETGKLRKETSWSNWRDTNIPNEIYDNVPTEGFVLNRHGGGRPSWSERKSFVRVHDPRGFEFEIDMDNLMYILECCEIGKGKVIQGECVLAWDGTELVLLPVNSPDYESIQEYTNLLKNKETIKGKDLKVGYTYIDKDEDEFVYLGKFPEYSWDFSNGKRGTTMKKSKAKKFFFAKKYGWAKDKEFPYYVKVIGSLGKKFIKELEIGCVQDFTPFQELLEKDLSYSPVDESKNEYIPIDQKYIVDILTNKEISSWDRKIYFYLSGMEEEYRYKVNLQDKYDKPYTYNARNRNVIDVEAVVERKHRDSYYDREVWKGSLEDFFKEYTPCYIQKYLDNGEFYKTEGSVPEEK